MPLEKNMVLICVPESLIPNLAQMSGPVLLYLNKLTVEDGFALEADEFVTYLRSIQAAMTMSGVTPESFAIML